MTIVLDFTHDPATVSWLTAANGHADFPIQNLPFGIFAPSGGGPRGGVAIGDRILDVAAVAPLLDGRAADLAALAAQPTLNLLFAQGQEALGELRRGLHRLLSDPSHQGEVTSRLFEAVQCSLQIPFAIGDYTDFYTGICHAQNIGKQFRPDNPLLPNYKYVPIGYHGRSSSIRLSGVDVRRPFGQTKAPDAAAPSFGPCRRLDYELEMAIWVGEGNALRKPIPIAEASTHIGGFSLLNDWSARDIQAWEYQPLGPFLAKNFQTTISPWVVTPHALAPFRIAQPPRPEGDPAALPYLHDDADQAQGAYDVTMDVSIQTERMRQIGMAPHRLSRGSMTAMYWTVAQLLAHHASNGCDLQPGDMLGTGTLSGAGDGSMGSLMEISLGGKRPITLPSGEQRSFLEDGDEVIMTAFAGKPDRARIGFGECRARILPA
jgi:fumarylacetoacetase